MIRNALFILYFIFLTIPGLQGQWVREQGKGYYKLSAWSLVSDQHYTDTGEIDPNATRGYFNVNFYGEYGITDAWEVVAYIPFFSRTYQNEQISGTTSEVLRAGESLNSLGDVDISLRHGLFRQGPVVLASTLKFGIPTGNDSAGSDGSFQTGDGEFNQTVQLDVGIPFRIFSYTGYSRAYLGFNNRNKGFSDELLVGGEAGLNFLKRRLWLVGRMNVVESLQNGSHSVQSNQGSIFANNIEYISLGAEVAWYLTERWGISLAYGGAVRGRIIYANPTYSAGVFLDIR